MRKRIAKKVAVFDIDGTVFRSSLLIELVDAMIVEGIFPKTIKRSYEREYRSWLDRKGTYDDYIWAVIKQFDGQIKGIERKRFMAIAERVAESHKNRVYRYTRELIKTLHKKGYYLLAISHSPFEIVRGFARELGFDKVYAMVQAIDARGRFTGSILHKDTIRDKASILKRAVEIEGLSLKGSIGVGDTESDIPFLSLVDRPICFNPNKKLYTHARRKKWKVVVERKDVIYDL